MNDRFDRILLEDQFVHLLLVLDIQLNEDDLLWLSSDLLKSIQALDVRIVKIVDNDDVLILF